MAILRQLISIQCRHVMEGSGNSDVGSDQASLLATPYYTPYQKQILQKSVLQPVNMDLSPSSGGNSSVASTKERSGSHSSSSSSSDSEPESESVIPSSIDYHGMVGSTNGKGPREAIKLKADFSDMEGQNQLAGEEKTAASILWEKENRNYDELLKKFIKNEEELRASNFKLQHSEEEINKLKIQIEKSEGQLENVLEELKLKGDDLEYEKGKVLELQMKTVELETRLPNCNNKIAKLEEELEVANEQLKISNDEIARLRKELGSRSSETHQLQGQLEVAQENVAILQFQLDSGRKQVQELEDSITWYKANETNLEHEMQKLNAEILAVRDQFSLEKDQLHSEIESLSEMKIQLTSRLEEWEYRSSLLEKKLRKYEAENLKQEELHANEISSLKEELGQRRHDVEAVNREFDGYKQKFDMLMTERDEANARIDKLKAEISFRDDQIANIERELSQLHSQQAEMISESETRLNLVNELKLKVEELEKEVTKQNAMISDLAEEKREAIRQLCFSLEHYRGGYQELLRAFPGHRLRAVIAS